MTEDEWLSSAAPGDMLRAAAGKVSGRKLRLFACAIARLLPALPDWRDEEERACAISAAERFADGLASATELYDARLCSRGEGFWTAAHPDPAEAAEISIEDDQLPGRSAELAELLREVAGNPFRPVSFAPAWRTPTAVAVALAAYEERSLPRGTLDPTRLAILADALEEAGCTSADILDHLRSPGPHVRGCCCVDLVLGRS